MNLIPVAHNVWLRSDKAERFEIIAGLIEAERYANQEVKK